MTVRDGTFDQYFHSMEANMKWVCALDRNHYEFSLPLELRDLSLLQERHPGLHLEFTENKRFVGQRSQNPFSRMGIDQCNENKVDWIKNESGVIGNLDDPATVRRDIVARPELARIVESMIGDTTVETEVEKKHHDMIPSKQKKFKV